MNKGQIKSWKPFLAKYKSYNGELKVIKFICNKCGSRDCERLSKTKPADPYFFQGEFKCSNCGVSDLNYYSDCFLINNELEKQLSLFDFNTNH